MSQVQVVVVPVAATFAATVDPHERIGAQARCVPAYVAHTLPMGTNSGEGGSNYRGTIVSHESLDHCFYVSHHCLLLTGFIVH